MQTTEQRRAARQQRREQRRVARAMTFNRCPLCSYDLATGEGERGCHYYDCPYLPDLLDVTCPTCRFNFFTSEGDANCGDPPRCTFARNQAPLRVATLTQWLQRHARTRIGQTGQPPTAHRGAGMSKLDISGLGSDLRQP